MAACPPMANGTLNAANAASHSFPRIVNASEDHFIVRVAVDVVESAFFRVLGIFEDFSNRQVQLRE
jgi:hypothetical protein